LRPPSESRARVARQEEPFERATSPQRHSGGFCEERSVQLHRLLVEDQLTSWGPKIRTANVAAKWATFPPTRRRENSPTIESRPWRSSGSSQHLPARPPRGPRGTGYASPIDFANTVIDDPSGQATIWHGLRRVIKTLASGASWGMGPIGSAAEAVCTGPPPQCWPTGSK
jgi:hypothetical protein